MPEAPPNPFDNLAWLARRQMPAPLADRIGRVSALARCRDALQRGELPTEPDRLLLAAALGRWLAGETFDAAAQVQPKQGSKRTVQVLYREVCGTSSAMWNIEPNSDRLTK